MKEKIVVYTAVFGDHNKLIDQPKYNNIDYVCYTNLDIKSNTWQIIKVEPPINNDATRSNRYFKILPHKHLSNYDISVYIDANFLILSNFTSFIREKLKSYSLLCFDHNKTDVDKRNCIYKEHEAILEIGKNSGFYKGDPKIMEQQINRYKTEKYPKNNGLISAGVLIRNHNNKQLMDVMEKWWNEVKNESKRDQLSFNYVAWKLNYTDFYYLDGDIRKGNPWFRWIPHEKINTFKILKIKFKHRLKLLKNR